MDFIAKIKNNFNKTTSEVINFFNETKDFCKLKYKSKKFNLIIVGLLIIATIIVLLALSLKNDTIIDNIERTIFLYIAGTLYLYVFTICSYKLYLINKSKFFKYISVIFFVFTIIFSIPLIIFVSMFEYLANIRARDITIFLFGMIHTMFALTVYSGFFTFASEKIHSSLNCLFLYKIKEIYPQIDEFSFLLFGTVLLIKIFSNFIYYAVLFIEEYVILKVNKKFIIRYYKNLLKKLELSFLIFFFILTSFKLVLKEEYCFYVKHESQIINLITLTTLILLLLDKYTQWNNELKEQIKDNENN